MEYAVINYEGNTEKVVPDQISSLNKRDDEAIKIK